MDLHIGTTKSTNSAALEVACPPPGHRAHWEAKEIPRNGKEKYSSLCQICTEMDVHQTPAYSNCVPVLQGDTMELQRGLPFAAISAEKSPLLACIKGRVAAEDDDHFATVWVRRTARQKSRQQRI
jgi:hypothetical protein